MFAKDNVFTPMHVDAASIDASSCDSDSIAEEIKKRLEWIKTPMLLKDFERKIAEVLHPCCTEIRFEWDSEPLMKITYLGDGVVYTIESHIDGVVCDGHYYEVYAEYEFYDFGLHGITIVHSFKPKEVIAGISDISESE